MHITLSPMRRDDTLSLHRAGEVLAINGTAFDFSPLPEGAILPREAVACDWLASDVTRKEGEIRLTLILPHGPIPWPAPPEAMAVIHPAALLLTGDGPVTLPVYTPAAEEAEA